MQKVRSKDSGGSKELRSLGGGGSSQVNQRSQPLYDLLQRVLGKSSNQGPAQEIRWPQTSREARLLRQHMGVLIVILPACHAASLGGVRNPEKQERTWHFLHPGVPRCSVWQGEGGRTPSVQPSQHAQRLHLGAPRQLQPSKSPPSR